MKVFSTAAIDAAPMLEGRFHPRDGGGANGAQWVEIALPFDVPIATARPMATMAMPR